MKEEWIGVLDCNNFFVSCERLFRPELQKKPVVVLSSNDGCVVARSQEIKDMGVPMGVPYFKIKDTLKNADTTVFSSHFALYRDISRRVFAVMREVLGEVEQYSIDEAFFTLNSDPEAQAWKLKQEVEKRVGIPVSVGIATTKTLAKYANDLAKKGNGVAVLDMNQWPEASKQVSLSSIWGVGGKLEIRYKGLGLLTVHDLVALDKSRVERLFGVVGLRLQAELSGVSVFKLGARLEPQKSIMSSRSFADSVHDLHTLKDAVAYHLRHAAADLRAMNSLATKVFVSIRPSRHGDFMLRGGTRELVLTTPTNNTIALLQEANRALDELFEAGVPYKKAGVVLAGLIPAGGGQHSLFGSNDTADAEALLNTIDSLNTKSGRELVLIGSRLRTTSWQTRSESRSPAYTTNWSDIAKVSAR